MNVVRINFRDFVSARQAAEMMNVAIDYLWRLRSLGALVPAGKVGNANVYRRMDVERYIAAHPNLGTRRAASR